MSAKGALVASGQRGENADAIVWDYERKSLLFRLSEHDHAVSALAFSHDELLLCTVGNVDDGKLLVWDMANGCIVDDGVQEPSPTVCVAWGGFVKDVKRRDTQDYLFCTAGGKKLSLWSLNPYSGELSSERGPRTAGAARRAHVHVRDAGEPTCVVYTLDFLISGWSDGKIRAHESDTSTPLWLIDHAAPRAASPL
ncbi:WD repeat-containing protein [Aureococcus anophagefferens]|nr:WD repeat-containing protein [Aureococcus anophagefferens]